MSIARIAKVKDELTRTLLYEQECEIQRLRQEIERLKRPTSIIGFQHNPSTASIEMAFPNSKFKGGD